jgi:predicted peptidase
MSYELAYFNPSRFAALVPVSATISDPLITGNPQAAAGSSYPLVAQTLKTLPTWVWHGTSDGTVSITYPRNIVQAFRNAGANIQYTEIQGGGHSGTTWDVVYGSAQLYQWLWTQHR